MSIISFGNRSGLRKVIALATAVTLSGAAAIVPVAALAQTTPETIAALQAQIAALQAQLAALAGGGTPSAGKCTSSRDLTIGSRGDDVTCLQNYLTSTGHFTYSGGATGYFGPITRTAVAEWQAANGVSPAAGYFGPISYAKYNSLVVGIPTPTPNPTPPGTPTPPPASGTGLTVSASTNQPPSNLAPIGAANVPFTNVTFTASNDGDITVNSVTVERQGFADDDAFDSVIILDENGGRIGTQKNLNSLHQAVLNEPFVVKAGTSRTLTVAANMLTAAPTPSNSGQVAYLAVVAVNAGSATVTGAFPIRGNSQTINETLTIGTVSMQRGAIDPGASVTKEVGTTGYTFSSVRVTAGSAEKVYLRYIRWNQVGSAAPGDLTNVKTYVDGTAYDAAVSTNGKYYTTWFNDNNGRGILIDKGFSKEISVKADVTGGSGRTVAFDLAKRTDVGLVGETYGYGIIPPQTGSAVADDASPNFTTSEDPWYNGGVVTVSAGTLNVTTSSSVPAQNIAVNSQNQPFGAFSVDVKGEQVTVGRIAFNITLGSEGANDDVDDLTNISLVDQNGSVVAGPVDGSATDSSNTTGSGDGSVVFSTSVTFPIGLNTYTLRGKVGTDIDNNVTITASTTPSTDFATVKGLTTGNTITPSPASAISFNTMTVKAGSLTATVSSIPLAQTIIANSKGFEFARFILDATASGEDIRLNSVPIAYGVVSGAASDITNCQLFDGATSLTTGSNIKNPSAAASSTTFTFDSSGLIVTKGTSKSISLKCDLRGGATGVYQFGLDSDSATAFAGATGVGSGQTITETINDSSGQQMTAATGGTLTVVADASNPSYKIVASGTTGVELVRLKFSALNEDIDLRQVALVLSQVASNTPDNLVGRKVKLIDASNNAEIGEAVFPTGDNATSSLIASGSFRIPRDGAKVIIVKGDISAISASGPLTRSGDLLVVNYDGNNNGLNGNYGTGVSSGNTITPSSATPTDPGGVRIMRSHPTVARIPLTSAELLLSGGTTLDKIISKFSITANSGDVSLYKLTFDIGSSSLAATTSLYAVNVYTDSGFSQADAFASNGLLNAGKCFNGLASTAAGPRTIEIYPDKTSCNSSATTTYIIPSGQTRYFALRATVTSVETGTTNTDQFTVALAGDAAFPVNASTLMQQASGVDGDTNDDFIWSPISTTTQNTILDLDFTNGFQVPGLPATGLTSESLQSN